MPPRTTRSAASNGGIASSTGTLKHAFGTVGKTSSLRSTKTGATITVSEKADKLFGVVVPSKASTNAQGNEIVLVETVTKATTVEADTKFVEEKQEVAVVKVKKARAPAKRVPSARKRKAQEEAAEEKVEDVPVVKATRTRGAKKVVSATVTAAEKVVIQGEDKEEEVISVVAAVPVAVETETSRPRKRTKIIEFMSASPSKAAATAGALEVKVTSSITAEETEIPSSTQQTEASPLPPSTSVPKTPSKPKAARPKATPRSNRKSTAALDPRQTTLQLTPLATGGNALSAINSLLGKKAAPAGPPPVPEYLTHLTNIHSHLLTTIHLHLAQNGPYSLPSFTTLKPHLERLSKRTVDLNDIRKICWLAGYTTSSTTTTTTASEPSTADATATTTTTTTTTTATSWLRPVDYGNNKIAIEFTPNVGGIGEINKLRSDFISNVASFWNDGVGHEEVLVVPMAEIMMSRNKSVIEAVLMGKGVERKNELKKGPRGPRGKGATDPAPPIIRKKAVEVKKGASEVVKKENVPPAKVVAEVAPVASAPAPAPATASATSTTTATSTTPKPTTTTTSTPAKSVQTPLTTIAQSKPSSKLSLLDRIRAKHQATLLAASLSPTASLSPAEIAAAHARVSAEQRLPEIIPILRSLRLRAAGSGAGRRSMGLDEVVMGIRQSVRNGITREEAELCVRLAGETGEEKKKEGEVKGEEGKVSELGAWKKSWGQKDEKGWVEVVECGGVKAVVFK